jgi:hypothetical protein
LGEAAAAKAIFGLEPNLTTIPKLVRLPQMPSPVSVPTLALFKKDQLGVFGEFRGDLDK